MQQRLLQAARSGDPVALAQLWDSSVDELWSIAQVICPQASHATELLVALREGLGPRARGLSITRSWRAQALGLLWEQCSDGFAPLETVLRRHPRSPGPDQAPSGLPGGPLQSLPVEVRAVFIFHLLGDLEIGRIATLYPASEMDCRRARAWASYVLVDAARETGDAGSA